MKRKLINYLHTILYIHKKTSEKIVLELNKKYHFDKYKDTFEWLWSSSQKHLQLVIKDGWNDTLDKRLWDDIVALVTNFKNIKGKNVKYVSNWGVYA